MPVNVTVQNRASATEVASIQLFANATSIFNGTLSIDSQASEILNCPVDTGGLPIGNYTITASATPLGDSNAALSTMSGGTVGVTYVGDLNGDFKVDANDFFIFMNDYIVYWTTGYTNPAADFNHDGKIDFNDLVAFDDAYIAYCALMRQQTQSSAPQTGQVYSYAIQTDGSGGYEAANDATGQIVYQSTDSSQVFSNVVKDCPADSGIDVKSGVYTVTTTWTMTNANNVTLNFESGTTLNAINDLNSPVMLIQSSKNCVISCGTFNGNAANQADPKVTGDDCAGIEIVSSSNCQINNANITNVRQFGFYICGGTNCGITNSVISYCGWNGMTLGGGNTPQTDFNDYAINNQVSHCSDVGITNYGNNDIVTGNYVHDMDQETGWGGSQCAHWGIACEGGGGSGSGNYELIAGNTITNVGNGIVVDSSDQVTGGSTVINYVLISGNTITNGDLNGPAPVKYGASIFLSGSSGSIIEYNNINVLSGSPTLDGIGQNANGVEAGNTIYGNTFSYVTTDIDDGGTGTIYTAPSIIAVTATSSPTGSGLISVNGNAESTPYTFYATVGSTQTLTANTVSGYTFTGWSDGGAQSHTITVPTMDTAYTATYSSSSGGSG